MVKTRRIRVLGVPVDCVTRKDALNYVDELLEGSKASTIIAINPEKVIAARNNPLLLDCIENAGLLIPDGIGIVLASKLLGLGQIERVPGSELMPAICRKAATTGNRIFLFGATPEVNEKTAEVLQNTYQGIHIVGNQHGYIDDEEMDKLVECINQSDAQILFVALGSPRQEIWMRQYLTELNIKVCMGVGGTFDVIAGNVKRAPLLFRQLHLEWFYRLASQPKRLFRQTALPKFTYQILNAAFKLTKGSGGPR